MTTPNERPLQQLPRRTFLRGMGLAMGLPWLESLLPREARAAGKRAPVRMAFVFFPNGAIMRDWKPADAGEKYTLPATLDALAEHRANFSVITGLAQDNGRAKGDGPGDHARCASTYLTGAHPYKTTGADIRVGVSVDQVAADRIGRLTKLPSIELGIEAGRNAGNCDSGYSCAYSANVSWKSESTPMAKEVNPRLAFERLFGGGSQEHRQDSLAHRQLYRQSILDMVADDAADLTRKLGATDRRKLDEYFTSVRELERRIESDESGDIVIGRPHLDLPQGTPKDVQQHIRLMYDVLALAFQSDVTRVATFMLGNAGSNRSYPMVDVTEGHHQLSHHGNEEEKMAKIQRIDRFLADQFAYFLGKLGSIAEGEGTLLDNCMICYGSGLSDGNRHDHADLPIVLAGRGGNTLKTGRHIDLGSETPLNNLFLSMLDRVGAGVDKLGDSSGRLTQIDG
ncbi:MAG: DUF1552 domain-containing protein [Planctomycetales bacterium]|nr:DUF1552 domain-containing protein [Planctomycetales bacterium]